jgi:flagellar hook-associated protein 2
MGSPISFSGFNNIDFGAVLNAIMLQERQPLTAIETKRTALQAQNTQFSTLATKLAALESAADDLTETDSLTAVAATSSDPTAVGISAGNASVTGSYSVAVTNLAQAQVTSAQTDYGSVDEVVATAGVISLARFSDPPIDITLTGPMTLQGLADAINANADSPASAAIVQVSPGNYRLVLTGRASGADNGFTVQATTPLTGGTGLTFKDQDSDGISGEDVLDREQSALDASLTVNGLAVTSASNVLNDVVPGVTLTLFKPSATASVEVTKNQDATIATVEKFVTAYNDLQTFIKDQTTASIAGKASIARDPMVRGLRDALRSTLLDDYDGTLERLAVVGVGFDTAGKMKLDKTLFKSMVSSSPNDVKELFSGADGTGGIFGEVKTLVEGYTQAGGFIADVRERNDQHVSRLGQRITNLEAQLAIRRAALQQEFIAADRAMSQLTAQGGSLSSLGGQYRLF